MCIVTGQASGQTVPTADLTSPKAAAASFFRAVGAGDAAGMLKAIAPTDAAHRELVLAYVDLIGSTHRFAAAIQAKFPTDGKSSTAATLEPAELRQLDSATVRENGESATIQFPGRDLPLKLMRNGTEWRVDLPTFAGGDRSTVVEQTAFVASLSAALSDSADAVGDGRFATLADAQAALQSNVHSALMTVRKSSARPTTKPTTAPTP